jgi:hypothetical protein
MSDLTTLATLSRVLGRAKQRFSAEMRWDPSALRVLEVILEELHREIDGPPPPETD